MNLTFYTIINGMEFQYTYILNWLTCMVLVIQDTLCHIPSKIISISDLHLFIFTCLFSVLESFLSMCL